jgi:hypothetical protein
VKLCNLILTSLIFDLIERPVIILTFADVAIIAGNYIITVNLTVFNEFKEFV